MGVAYNSRIITDGLVLALDAANPKSYPTKNFVSSKIYSSFGGSIRSSNYTVQYSDDNSNWTTAFTGVASNNTSCGIQQNTGSGSGSYGLHRYWRYVEGSPIQSHHPRVSRIILTDINGIDYNLVVYTSDNCSDTGTYQVGTVSLDFGGTTWTDMSTNGNTGTLVNGVGYSASNGGALVFDGVDDRVTITNTIPSLSNFTIELFMQTSLLDGTQDIFFDQFSSLRFEISSNKYRIHLGNGSGWAFTDHIGNTTLSLNTWYHSVWTWNGSTSALYLNGVSDGTRTYGAASSGTGSISVGQHTPDTSYNWNGRIGSIRIYNRALTAAEVSQNFNALRGRYGI